MGLWMRPIGPISLIRPIRCRTQHGFRPMASGSEVNTLLELLELLSGPA
jgi:hypothetical protein